MIHLLKSRMMNKSMPTIVSICVGAVSLSLVAAYVILSKKRKKVFSRVAKVKTLYFYPVKSMKGIEVEELKVVDMGVEAYGLLDRSFMLISKDGDKLVSMRQEPSLILIDVLFSRNQLTLSHGDSIPLHIPIKSHVSLDDEIVNCNVHNGFVKGIDCGDEIANWLQKYLNRSDIRLVQCLPELGGRKFLQQRPSYAEASKGHKIGFQDEGAVHVLSESSIEELNNNVEEKISKHNFRPNILVEECQPYAEDEWQSIHFPSGAEITTVHPCGRCILTTVNPVTGVKADKDPLDTLRKIRMLKDPKLAKDLNYSPCFGIICRIDHHGTVKVGDIVTAVVEKGQYEIGPKS